MSRIGIRCKDCESTYDVTDFEPGSQVQCGVCGTLLTVPDASKMRAAKAGQAAAGRAAGAAPAVPVAPRRGSSRGGRRGSSSGGSRRGSRGGSGRSSSPSSAARRSQAEDVEDGYEEGPRYERQKKGNGLTISLIAIAVMAVFGGLFASGIFETAPEPAPDPTKKERDPAELYVGMKSRFEENYQKLTASLSANLDPEAPKTSAGNCMNVAYWIQSKVIDHVEDLEIPADEVEKWKERRREVARKALEYEKDHMGAHGILDNVMFQLEPENRGRVDIFETEAREELIKYIEQWVSREEYDRLKEIEKNAATDADAGDEEGNAFTQNCHWVLNNFRSHDVLKDKEWDFRISQRDDAAPGHFALFEEKVEGQDFSSKVLDKARILEREYDFMKEHYFDSYGFERDVTEPLVVIALKDWESYVKFVTEHSGNAELANQTLGYYSHQTRYFTYFNGIPPGQSVSDDEVLMHECVHQIESAFCDKPNDPSSKVRPGWRVEGWADYIAGFPADTIDQKEHWDYGELRSNRTALMSMALNMEKNPAFHGNEGVQGVSLLLPIKKLAGVMNKDAMMYEVLERMPQQAAMALRSNAMFENTITNLMYAQGCFTIYFFNGFENGKYREQFMEYMQATFNGECNTANRSRNKLAECLGFLSTNSDARKAEEETNKGWEALEVEWKRWLDQVLAG